MGLTIHFKLETNTSSPDDARKLVEQLRQKALDLPFKEVGEISTSAATKPTSRSKQGQRHRWLLIRAEGSVPKGGTYRRVKPIRIIAFSTWPGDGSEPANSGWPSTRKPSRFRERSFGPALPRGRGLPSAKRSTLQTRNAAASELPSLPPGRRRTPRSR